jgi:uncharacterized protein (TIGR00255 family)
MTGFGRDVVEEGGARLEVEVRTVNHRGLKMSVRLPEPLASLQAEIEALVKARLERGTVHVDVVYESAGGTHAYEIDRDAIRRYVADLDALRRELGIEERIAIERVALLPGAVVARPASATALEDLFRRVRAALGRALDALDVSRRREGAALADDLRRRRGAIAAALAAVKARVPLALAGHRERFRERMRQLLEGAGVTLDPQDLAREAALFAERTDISEEVTRLESHLEELDRALATDGPVGRRLDFLAQEMLREANTMGSKSQDADLVREVLAIKLEVDKIKEQVANVE